MIGVPSVIIAVPSKHLSNFWRTLEMFLINCEINLILTKSAKCLISEGNLATTFTIRDEKILCSSLSTQDNEKLLQELKSCFKRTIN